MSDTQPFQILGVGDVMVARHDETLFDHVADALRRAAVTFGNCEWPYAEQVGDTHPVEEHLNNLIDEGDLFLPGDPASVRLIGRSGFDVMSFANNHCLHAGYRAFLRTMELLRESGVQPAGGGRNLEEALAPVIVERDDARVAFIACTSAMLPGTQAGRRTAGVAPLRRHSYFENPAWEMLGIAPDIRTLVNRDDLAAVCTRIRAVRDRADIVVISCHWGFVEERTAIGAYQREAAHAFIEAGADLIFGHGPLTTRGIEMYQGKAIFYSLGKFLMRGPVPTGEVPLGITAPLGRDSRKGLAAVATIVDRQIKTVAFRPCFADEMARPSFVGRDHPQFDEIVEDVRSATIAAGLNAKFQVTNEGVIVTD
jgi:poly-gamma-glutamate synthesis protein (capsule biosynthesis protein)